MRLSPRATVQAGLLLALISLWPVACAAATFSDKPLTYRVKNMDGKVVSATIPFVVTEDGAVADRINTFLHMRLLDTLPPLRSNKLSAVRVIDYPFPLESMQGGIDVTNSGRILRVSVEAEGCGAYCSTGTSNFSFDTRNGRVLSREEVITPQAKTALAAMAIKADVAKLRAEIALIKQAEKDKKDMLDDESRATQLEMYQSCLASRFAKGGDMFDMHLADPGAIDIGDGAISFSQDPCGYHAVQALDDLGAFVLTLKGEEMRPYLSAYGKYLFYGEGDGKVDAINRYAQLFHGKINGTIAVTLYAELTPDGSGAAGPRYFYDKYGKAIELSMSRDGEAFVLTETDSKNVPQPALRFTLQGQRLVGEWRGGGKVYPFEAGP